MFFGILKWVFGVANHEPEPQPDTHFSSICTQDMATFTMQI